jgi:hypothetical protein
VRLGAAKARGSPSKSAAALDALKAKMTKHGWFSQEAIIVSIAQEVLEVGHSLRSSIACLPQCLMRYWLYPFLLRCRSKMSDPVC